MRDVPCGPTPSVVKEGTGVSEHQVGPFIEDEVSDTRKQLDIELSRLHSRPLLEYMMGRVIRCSVQDKCWHPQIGSPVVPGESAAEQVEH